MFLQFNTLKNLKQKFFFKIVIFIRKILFIYGFNEKTELLKLLPCKRNKKLHISYFRIKFTLKRTYEIKLLYFPVSIYINRNSYSRLLTIQVLSITNFIRLSCHVKTDF